MRQIFDNIFSITVFISTWWSNGFFKFAQVSYHTKTIYATKRGRQNDMYIFTVLIFHILAFGNNKKIVDVNSIKKYFYEILNSNLDL